MGEIEVREPANDQEWEDYYRVRYERLRKPLGLAPGSERDHPAEPSSMHAAAIADGRVVGSVCWAIGMRQDAASGQRSVYVRLRQIAVDTAYERRGVGAALERIVERKAREVRAAELVANARLENVEFFRRQGWVEVGEGVTLYDQVESVAMAKALN